MMCGSTIENLKQIEGQSTDFFELKLYISSFVGYVFEQRLKIPFKSSPFYFLL